MIFKPNTIATIAMVVIASFFFGGIGMAIYTENAVWLLLSVFAFCVMYAG